MPTTQRILQRPTLKNAIVNAKEKSLPRVSNFASPNAPLLLAYYLLILMLIQPPSPFSTPRDQSSSVGDQGGNQYAASEAKLSFPYILFAHKMSTICKQAGHHFHVLLELVVVGAVAVGTGIAFDFGFVVADHLYRLGYRRVGEGLVLGRVGSSHRGGICLASQLTGAGASGVERGGGEGNAYLISCQKLQMWQPTSFHGLREKGTMGTKQKVNHSL